MSNQMLNFEINPSCSSFSQFYWLDFSKNKYLKYLKFYLLQSKLKVILFLDYEIFLLPKS